MNVIEGDLLDQLPAIICHQVNCQGVMGSGVAKAIRDRWPAVYDMFRTEVGPPETRLGKANYVGGGLLDDNPRLWVVNVYAQLDYGRPGQPRRRYTNYGAIAAGFTRVRHLRASFGVPVYIPYLLGCDRGGGDWSIVEEIIDVVCPGVTAVARPGTIRR